MRSYSAAVIASWSLAVWLAAGGCASWRRQQEGVGPPAVGEASTTKEPSRLPVVPDLAARGLEETALLLLLVDRQLYEPFSIGRVLVAAGPELRRLVGSTLARVPDPRALQVLEELAVDPDPRVRVEAAFAAGRIGGREGAALLEALLLDGDNEVAAWACHGLARLGAPLDRVVTRLAALPREARQARLLPDLHRFAASGTRGASFEAIALEGLTSADPWLRRRAALGLLAVARPAQAPAFRRLLADGDGSVRALAAAGLGKVGGSLGDGRSGESADGGVADLEALRLATRDADQRAAIAAVDAAAAIVEAGRAAPPSSWRTTLLALLGDPRPAVRAAAIAAAGAWLLDPELEAALAGIVRSGGPGERGRAIVALAAGSAPAAADLVATVAGDPEPSVRAAAARAAGSLRAARLLDRLAADSEGVVREAAFVARADLDAAPDAALHARFLADPATGARAAVLERLAGSPIVAFEPILTAFAADERAAPELALAGVAALRARALATPSERGAIVAALEGLADIGTYPVRVESAAALVALGRPRPGLGPATVGRNAADYRSVAARTRAPRWARIETRAGDALVRLDCADAALATLAFLQLAEQGFYDGGPIYEARPGALLLGGDPDGDGRGGPGFTLRDEPSARRLRAGAFGLVRPAAHASGSRFFVQLDDNPEHEGDVIRLGEVVAGLDVLAGLLEGDRVVRVREVAAPR